MEEETENKPLEISVGTLVVIALAIIMLIVGLLLVQSFLKKDSCKDADPYHNFQIHCDENQTKCTADFFDERECAYGFEAMNVCPNGNCFSYIMNKSNCTVIDQSEFPIMPFTNLLGETTSRYPEARGIQVRYVYEVECKPLGKLP